MPKIVGEGEMRSRIPSLKEFSYKMLNNHIGGNSNFMVKKIGGHHFNRVIKINITNNGTRWHHMPPDMMHWEGHKISYVVCLPKIHDQNLIMRKRIDTNPNGETFYKWLAYNFPRCHGHENQGKSEELSQIEGNQKKKIDLKGITINGI